MTQSGEIAPGIAVDPEVAHGKPVIVGARIPLEREYGLRKQQVHDALAYAAELVASESVYAVAGG
jgi:uncharacterized protein (DUF433 family)